MIELVVAIGILVSVMLPIAFAFSQEQKLARAYYFRAVAMEIVDGEMEKLLAGGWQSYSPGRQKLVVQAEAARNLPSDDFRLTIETNQIRLEWHPQKHSQGGVVSRVAALPPAANPEKVP